jgi:hypothetical protein
MGWATWSGTSYALEHDLSTKSMFVILMKLKRKCFDGMRNSTSKTCLINRQTKIITKNIKMGDNIIGSNKNRHAIWMKFFFINKNEIKPTC